MDKSILIIVICVLVFYIVYLKLNLSIQKEMKEEEEKEELELEDTEHFNNNNNNNIESTSKNFDPYTFYTKTLTKTLPPKITKENFDDNYETILDEDLKYFKEDFSGSISNTKLFTDSIDAKKTERFNQEVDTDNIPNFVYSVPFPENTSIELANFNAENVTDKFKGDNMEELYNTINADVYRGYKTLKYML